MFHELAMSRRTERVGSTLHQELAMIMMRELSDPRLVGLPSITRVKVSDDLSVADVFITVMGTPGQQTAALNALKHSAGMMRLLLTKKMTLRIAPFLKFHIDEDLKKELALQTLLQKVADENAEIDRKRAEEAAANPPPPEQQSAGEEQSSPPPPPLNMPEHEKQPFSQQPPAEH
jgi:ribosome-binding factor A